jgi:hypothetical protein
MRHPVMFLSEVAEAAIKTGEVNVELFAGVETVTLTHADANTGNEITHRTMESVHRIISFLLKGAVRSGGDLPRSPAHQAGYLRSAFWCLRYLSGRRNRMGGTTHSRLFFSLK